MPADTITAEEAGKLLAASTVGHYGGEIGRSHRTLSTVIEGKSYEIGTAHIATGDAKLFEASAALARTVIALEAKLNAVVTALTIPDGEPVTRDPVRLAELCAAQLSEEVARVETLDADLATLRIEHGRLTAELASITPRPWAAED